MIYFKKEKDKTKKQENLLRIFLFHCFCLFFHNWQILWQFLNANTSLRYRRGVEIWHEWRMTTRPDGRKQSYCI